MSLDHVSKLMTCILNFSMMNLEFNDLAKYINSEHCGVKVGVDEISILLYADDIVLVSGSHEKLQKLLDCFHK